MSEDLITRLIQAIRAVEAISAPEGSAVIAHADEALAECRKVLTAGGEESRSMARPLLEPEPVNAPPLMTFDPDTIPLW